VKTRGYVSALVKEDYATLAQSGNYAHRPTALQNAQIDALHKHWQLAQGKANPKLLNELLRSKLG
jgi:hypothetical protein